MYFHSKLVTVAANPTPYQPDALGQVVSLVLSLLPVNHPQSEPYLQGLNER
ncbi:hypothetical protein P3675_08345 [Vibrio parahaemolyticus]|uniref:Uncharacterized protein n=1 Tax=Vibrio vulnificus TaxID=672 RepID=A0AAW4H634_VIBVL|nr:MULTISPECIES: hypothetical protein [Vibrio]MDE0552166.1 hypothetical protein [Vibrio sp. VP6]ELY5142028.1 hypothetical protein [Vibrio vulnificus]MBE3745050.1 hypothetical protein [Vibrio parahaemolyticus]MBE4468325.1 hypothetical protein [Vibrio parahaemolyticus]MBN8083224.1 hypothetical protein [Vibrio vulnificus]